MDDNLPVATSDFLLYRAENGDTHIQVRFSGQTVWLTQDQMAELFDKGRTTITEHIQNAFKEGELDENSVCREFRRSRAGGYLSRGKFKF
jgi:hypothetical protein